MIVMRRRIFGNPIRIKILKSTRAFQLLMLESASPDNSQGSIGENGLIKGVDGGYGSIPLHKVHQ